MSRVVHFEIQVDDVERAKAFYAAVFGWSFEDYSQYTGSPYWGVLCPGWPGRATTSTRRATRSGSTSRTRTRPDVDVSSPVHGTGTPSRRSPCAIPRWSGSTSWKDTGP